MQDAAIEIAQGALITTIYLSIPMLGLALVVGLAISIFQATTQIQEQTLSFVPKIFAVFGALIVFGPWMMTTMVEYTENLFMNINTFIK